MQWTYHPGPQPLSRNKSYYQARLTLTPLQPPHYLAEYDSTRPAESLRMSMLKPGVVFERSRWWVWRIWSEEGGVRWNDLLRCIHDWNCGRRIHGLHDVNSNFLVWCLVIKPGAISSVFMHRRGPTGNPQGGPWPHNQPHSASSSTYNTPSTYSEHILQAFVSNHSL